jgi:membrane protease YdiL (CAAX protease family)
MSEMNGSGHSFLISLFYSPQERRLRAFWRILGQLVLLFVFGFLFSIALGWLLFLNLPEQVNFLIQQVIAFFAITLSVFLARRFLDRRSISSLGLVWGPYALQDLLVGFALPAFMMGLIFLTLWIAGWLDIEGFAWQAQPISTILANMALILLTFILVGWSEELFSRGYQLQNISDGLNRFWGVVLSSLIFAALHYANPSFNVSSLPFLGLIAAGLFLAYGYLASHQLWLPIGLHIGWNFFEGPVYGFPVSGLDTLRLIQHTVAGPGLITGGQFGPEGGLILLPALAIGSALIYLYTRRRNQEVSE